MRTKLAPPKLRGLSRTSDLLCPLKRHFAVMIAKALVWIAFNCEFEIKELVSGYVMAGT